MSNIGLKVNIPIVPRNSVASVGAAASSPNGNGFISASVPMVKVSGTSVTAKVKLPIESVGDIKVSARAELPTPDIGMSGIIDTKVDLQVFNSSTVSNLSAKVSSFSPGKSIFRVATNILIQKKDEVGRAKNVTDSRFPSTSVQVSATVKL